ncbi:hypothetical protein WA026_017365 [Henosepilachna vigintioctopunctata]|uniref:Helix-turn-helix domain-containing protein n=1 Tax=Henosepilachna vigintioctopunctata TaxID=420089 RepID=A0AAW1VB22_9CUCU
MDAKVIRRDQTLISNSYVEPSASEIMNYQSNHTMTVRKYFVIQSEDRLKKIVHPSLIKQNLTILERKLTDNGYPRQMIKKPFYSTETTENEFAQIITNNEQISNNEEAPYEVLLPTQHKLFERKTIKKTTTL